MTNLNASKIVEPFKIFGSVYYLTLITIGTVGNIITYLVIRSIGSKYVQTQKQRLQNPPEKMHYNEIKPLFPNGNEFNKSSIQIQLNEKTSSIANRNSRKSFRKAKSQSSEGIFIALALADTVALWINPIRYIILFLNGYDIRLWNNLMCKVHVFATYGSFDFAVWVLCFFTLERYLIAKFPHKVRIIWKLRYKVLICTIVLIFLLAKNLLILVIVEVQAENNSTKICDSPKDNSLRTIFFWMDLIFRSIIPTGFLLFFNINLIGILRSSRKLRQGYLEGSSFKSDNSPKSSERGNNVTTVATFRSLAKMKGSNGHSFIRSEGSQRDALKLKSQTNKMLIPVSLFHLISSIPLAIFSILEDIFAWKRSNKETHKFYVKYFGPSLMMLAMTNHTLNCFIYFASSRNFRQQFNLLVGSLRCSTLIKKTSSRNLIS